MRILMVIAVVLACTAGANASLVEDIAKALPPRDLVLKPGVYETKWVVPPYRDDEWRKQRPEVPMGSVTFGPKVPRELKAKPKGVSPWACFGRLVLDQWSDGMDPVASPILVIADRSTGEARGDYDTLYIDADGDGDFHNESRLAGEPTGAHREFEFQSAVSVPRKSLVPSSSASQKVTLDLLLDISEPQTAKVVMRGGFEAEVDSSRGKVRCAVMDTNQNGRYDDPTAFRPPISAELGDLVMFDYDGSGAFGYPEHLLPCVANLPSGVGERLYWIKPSRAGDSLQISDYSGPTGKVAMTATHIGPADVSGGVVRLASAGGDFVRRVDGVPGDLPTGTYHVMFTLPGIEVSGHPDEYWEVRPGISKVSVQSSELASIDLSGSIRMAIDPASRALTLRHGATSQVSVALVLSGDVHAAGSSGKGTRPVVVLKDRSGRSACSGAECPAPQFGRIDYWYELRVPRSAKPGQYTLEATYDVGPFGGKLRASRTMVVK